MDLTSTATAQNVVPQATIAPDGYSMIVPELLEVSNIVYVTVEEGRRTFTGFFNLHSVDIVEYSIHDPEVQIVAERFRKLNDCPFVVKKVF